MLERLWEISVDITILVESSYVLGCVELNVATPSVETGVVFNTKNEGNVNKNIFIVFQTLC